MTVREALEPMVIDGMLNARDLAPKIEAALRAAYREGWEDSEVGQEQAMAEGRNKFLIVDERGVTAGIEAMGEEM